MSGAQHPAPDISGIKLHLQHANCLKIPAMYFARGLLSLNTECQLITLKQIDRGFRIEKTNIRQRE